MARKARPILVKDKKSWRPTSTTTATPRISTGNQPTAMSSVNSMLRVSNEPTSRPWESAEYCSSRAFWITTAKPNVTKIDGRGSAPIDQLNPNRWSTYRLPP